jgi:hypothetical protein
VKTEVSATPAPPPSDGSQGKGLRVAGIVCAVVGLAAVGTGIGLSLKTQDMSSEAQKSGGGTKAQEDQRKTLQTWGWVSYGVGAACVATGATLYYLGLRANRDVSHSVAVLPARDGAIFVVKGSL